MTTNIESALADMLEGLSVSDGYYQLSIGRVGAVKLAERIVKNEPDLKAALGIDELGCGCDEADDNLKAALRRAEDAEGDAREWKARAEKAEAAIQRVRDARNEWSKTLGRSGHVVEIDDALADKPAFTLPTEAGAVILATGRGNKQHYELHRTTTGRWITPGVREDWDDERVLSAFTDHRLIGAGQ